MMGMLIRRSLGLAALLAGGAIGASASTIAYYVDVFSGFTTAQLCSGATMASCPAGVTATLQSTSAAQNVTLSVPKLDQLSDPNPGKIYVLTQVAIGINWVATGDVTVYNFNNVGIPFTSAYAFTDMKLTASVTDVQQQAKAGAGPGTAVCCNILNGTPIYLGQTVFNGLSASGTANPQFAPNLSFYQGFGLSNFNALFSSTDVGVAGSSGSPFGGSLSYTGTGRMGAIATFEYTFSEIANPTPEPMTFATVGGALIGLGAIARRRLSRRA